MWKKLFKLKNTDSITKKPEMTADQIFMTIEAPSFIDSIKSQIDLDHDIVDDEWSADIATFNMDVKRVGDFLQIKVSRFARYSDETPHRHELMLNLASISQVRWENGLPPSHIAKGYLVKYHYDTEIVKYFPTSNVYGRSLTGYEIGGVGIVHYADHMFDVRNLASYAVSDRIILGDTTINVPYSLGEAMYERIVDAIGG